MGHVIQLDIPFRQNSAAARHSALIARFADHRRPQDDVFWLKENAEVLNVLDSGGAKLEPGSLECHAGFYAGLEKRLGFFPQYYRFLLSICLDLEDLGLDGTKGEEMTAWVVREGLPAAELSDLQRAEAQRLCLRRGVEALPGDTGLADRLRGFAGRTETFALPNKKAAYELTHIVFYLSEYGRKDPDLDAPVLQSLRFAGTLAFLEMNIDLLSEICIALRFAGQIPPDIWEDWLRQQARRFVIEDRAQGWAADDYHPYLMINWFLRISGKGGFAEQIPEGAPAFMAPRSAGGPLRELSEFMYRLDGARCDDWTTMRAQVEDGLSDDARHMIAAAETAGDFEAFFAGFARAGLQGAGG